MRISLSQPNSRDATRSRQLGYTMVEMMVATGVFVLLLGGIIYGYLFGLRLYQITCTKLGASDDARKALIKLTDDIRSAWKIQVGTGTLTNFVQCSATNYQTGNAIMVFPQTNNYSQFTLYYLDTNTTDALGAGNTNYTKLLMTTDMVNVSPVIAHCISNFNIFQAEDSYGNVLTNNLNNRVIGVTMQFYQIEYPVTYIGPGNYYDYYQLHTRVTRRTLY